MVTIVTIQESDGANAEYAGWNWARKCLIASAISRTINRDVVVGSTIWGFADDVDSRYPLPDIAREAVKAFDKVPSLAWRQFIGKSFTLIF